MFTYLLHNHPPAYPPLFCWTYLVDLFISCYSQVRCVPSPPIPAAAATVVDQ